MKFDKEPYEALSIDMTPLVDAIFAIILFLLVASSFVDSMEQDLAIDLPTQGREVGAKAIPAKPVVVNIRALPGGQPYYHIENERRELPDIRNYLSKRKMTYADQAVVIRGDRNVKWEHVAAVMSCCAEVGITKVSATVAIQESASAN